MSYLEQRLQEDLTGIRDWVWTLGDNVENAVRNAKRALLVRDEALAYNTVLEDNPINRDSRECDRLCHAFIARHLPSAGHLREMASTIRVNVALERVGDYAVTICREAMQLEKPLPDELQVKLDQLADESLDILHQSREAFRNQNADSAIAQMSAAKRIESKMDFLYESLFEGESELSGRTALVIFVVFSLLKRVADQAKNISDQTVFAVKGVAKMPKVYRILFLDNSATGRGLMAAAIGRKSYPETGLFDVATNHHEERPEGPMAEFFGRVSLETDDLASLASEHLTHDFGDYTIIVSLSGSVHDYMDKIPFHSTAQKWDVPNQGNDTDEEYYQALYRLLSSQLEQLMTTLVGPDAA